MKKLLLVAIAAAGISLTSYGQINKGTVLLGGSIGGSATTNKQGSMQQETNLFMISPAIGYAVQTNTVAGISFSYGNSKVKNNLTSATGKTKAYGAGFFVRRYKSLSPSFYLFGELAADYTGNHTETTNGFSSGKYITKGSAVSFGLTPGLAYVVNKRIHLEAAINSIASISYNSSKSYLESAPSNKTEQTSFDFQSNLSSSNPLSLGIRFVLGK